MGKGCCLHRKCSATAAARYSLQRMQVTAHLCRLILSPDASPNSCRIAKMTCKSLLSGLKNRTTSSAKIDALGTVLPHRRSDSSPCWTAQSSMPWTASMAKMNNAGDIGSPCLTPWPITNGAHSSPLIRMEVEAVESKPHIQEHHFLPKPLADRISNRNSHDKVSKAFDISIFINTAERLFRCSILAILRMNLKFS